MKPSNRIAEVQTYYFAGKLAEIKKLNAQGKNVINLGIGNPDLDAPNIAINTLINESTSDGASQYQPYKGIPELRIAFANWYRRIYNVHLNPEKEILPLMGSKEAVMHIHLAFCNTGDEVLVPNPGYPTYAASAKMLGLKVKYYDLLETNNWLPVIEQLEKLNTEKCKVLWVNYPHMPTGARANKDDLKSLVEFAKRNKLLIVNDNPYSLIQNNNPLSIHSCATDYSDVLELNSLSKSYNMAGWRVGIVSGSEENINHLLRVKSNFDSGMYRPVQLAATAVLQLEEKWSEALNTIYNKREKLVYKILDELNCNYNKKNKGLFVWAKINNEFPNGAALSDHLLYTYNVFATPGFVFGSNGEKYIRFSLCAKEEVLKEALRRIKK